MCIQKYKIMKKIIFIYFVTILSFLSLGNIATANNFFVIGDGDNDQVNDCPTPSYYFLRAKDITPYTATLYWQPAGSEQRWSVGYRKKDSKQTTYIEVDTPSVDVTGLEPGTYYVFKVAAICDEDVKSAYTGEYIFLTAELCPGPAEGQFVAVEDHSSAVALKWKRGGEENLWQVCYGRTGASTFDTLPLIDTPYVFISGLKYNSSYNVKIRSICSDDMVSNWQIYPFYTHDYNCIPPKNLTFSDITSNSAYLEWEPGNYEKSWTIQYKDENGYLSSTETVKTNHFTFSQLKKNTTYTVMLFSNCTSLRESEVIEASFTTTTDTCQLPTDITVADILPTSAVVSWKQASESADKWDLFLRRYKTLDWTKVEADQPSFTLTELKPETEYEVAVAEHCSANLVSDLTSPVRFKTLNETRPCDEPTDVAVTDISKNSAVVSWKQKEGTADNWSVYYKISGMDHWSDSLAAASTSATLENLDPITKYEVAVAAHCPMGFTSELSESAVFITKEDGVDDHDLSQRITLYPNPTTGMVNINDGTGLSTVKTVDVCDIYGRVLKTLSTRDDSIAISVADFADGVYFVRILTEQGIAHKTFIKK